MSAIEAVAWISLALSTVALAVALLLLASNRKKIKLLEALAEAEKTEALAKMGKLRKRYIVIAVVAPFNPSRKEVEEAIRRKLEELYGIIGLAKADPQLVYYEPKLKKGVIRTNQYTKDLVIAALSIIDGIAGKQALIIPVKTTGTIKKAKKILRTIKTKNP